VTQAPLLPALVRGAIAAVASLVITMLSLVLLAELNADPEPVEHTHALVGDRAVPVAPPPEPDPADEPTIAPLPAVVPTSASTPEASVDPPPPRPAVVAGLAPTAGPGGLPIATGELPSVAGLPSAALEAVASGEPDTPARVTHRPAPEYPAVAQRRGIEGFVTVRLRIDAQGRVADAVVVASEPAGTFDQSALQTVRRYRFSPARRGGEAIPTTLQQTIRFELE
jgi:protein TonB